MEKNRRKLAETVLDYVRDRLVAALPLMSHALLRLPADWNDTDLPDSVPERCGTDGHTIFWEAEDLLNRFQKDPDEPCHIFLHMIMHCIYTHMYAYEKMDPELWDLSCDIAAEYVIDLFQAVRKAPERKMAQKKVLEKLLPEVPEMTAETIYRFFKHAEEHRQNALQNASAFRLDAHDFWAQKQFRSVESDLTIYTKAAEFFDEKRAWKQIFQAISRLKEERSLYEGSMPGVQHIYLGSLTPAEQNYARILRRFATLEEETELDPDAFDMIFYTYGLSLYGNLPLIEPLEYRESLKIRQLVIAIDTSGSCQGDKVAAFLKNTCAILSGQDSFFDRFEVHIFQCDSKIQKEDVIHSKEEFERYMCDMEIIGAGGTDFRPLFSHVEEKIKDGTLRFLQGVIYFTDGLGMYPEKEPSVKTLFIYPDDKERRHPTPVWAESCLL